MCALRICRMIILLAAEVHSKLQLSRGSRDTGFINARSFGTCSMVGGFRKGSKHGDVGFSYTCSNTRLVKGHERSSSTQQTCQLKKTHKTFEMGRGSPAFPQPQREAHAPKPVLRTAASTATEMTCAGCFFSSASTLSSFHELHAGWHNDDAVLIHALRWYKAVVL